MAQTLLPSGLRELGVHVYHDMVEGLKDVDVVIMLRLQKERMHGALLPSEAEYFKHYGLTLDKLALARPMRLSCIQSRSIEVWKSLQELADSAQAVILPQVSFWYRCSHGGDGDFVRRGHAA